MGGVSDELFRTNMASFLTIMSGKTKKLSEYINKDNYWKIIKFSKMTMQKVWARSDQLSTAVAANVAAAGKTSTLLCAAAASGSDRAVTEPTVYHKFHAKLPWLHVVVAKTHAVKLDETHGRSKRPTLRLAHPEIWSRNQTTTSFV
jgi:hypothetical protein